MRCRFPLSPRLFASRTSKQTQSYQLDPPPILLYIKGKCHAQPPCKSMLLGTSGAGEDFRNGATAQLPFHSTGFGRVVLNLLNLKS